MLSFKFAKKFQRFPSHSFCELVGTFVLSKISPVIQEQNNVRLYRDDDLGIFENLSEPNIERKKKQEIIKIFKSFELYVSVTNNVTSADYVDVNFNLTTDICKLYRKTNYEPLYVNKHSCHSTKIALQILLSANQELKKIL